MAKKLKAKDEPFVSHILSYIDLNVTFKKKFSHHKQTIPNETLFGALLYKLRTGIAYRDIETTKYDISYQNLYRFHKKVKDLKLFETFYDEYISKYIGCIGNKFREFYMDSTLVANKYGSDKADYNKQLPKHKSTKISLIVDEFNIPISYKITSSNDNDSPVIQSQIIDLADKYPILCDNQKIFIGDAGYDSKKIADILTDKKLGILDTPINNRNTKDQSKIRKISLYSKMLHNKRSKIEHANNLIKKYKTINVRYQRSSKSFENYVLLSLIVTSFYKLGNIDKYI